MPSFKVWRSLCKCQDTYPPRAGCKNRGTVPQTTKTSANTNGHQTFMFPPHSIQVYDNSNKRNRKYFAFEMIYSGFLRFVGSMLLSTSWRLNRRDGFTAPIVFQLQPLATYLIAVCGRQSRTPLPVTVPTVHAKVGIPNHSASNIYLCQRLDYHLVESQLHRHSYLISSSCRHEYRGLMCSH